MQAGHLMGLGVGPSVRPCGPSRQRAAAHSWAVGGERETEAVGGRLKPGRADGLTGGDGVEGRGGRGARRGWWGGEGGTKGGRGQASRAPLATSKGAIFLKTAGLVTPPAPLPTSTPCSTRSLPQAHSKGTHVLSHTHRTLGGSGQAQPQRVRLSTVQMGTLRPSEGRKLACWC